MAMTITRKTYLMALGLFTLGASYQRKAADCVTELEKLLGVPDSDLRMTVFGDAIFSGGDTTLDEAMRRCGITIEEKSE